jgi:hypothetical protein
MRRFVMLSWVLALPAAVAAQADPNTTEFPAEGPPAENPPPPATEPEPPPAEPGPARALPAGQWVYTAQYGWLWMPYDRAYTYVPPDPQLFPDMYVYYPAYGWRWVVAPWVYGYGPQPYWGRGGVRFYVWYAHPWFRVGGYWGWGAYRGWGPYRGWVGPRVWGPRGWAGAPPYYRSGVGHRPPRPVIRPERHERREHDRR